MLVLEAAMERISANLHRGKASYESVRRSKNKWITSDIADRFREADCIGIEAESAKYDDIGQVAQQNCGSTHDGFFTQQLWRIFPGVQSNRFAVVVSSQRIHLAARYAAVFGNRNFWQ